MSPAYTFCTLITQWKHTQHVAVRSQIHSRTLPPLLNTAKQYYSYFIHLMVEGTIAIMSKNKGQILGCYSM